MNIRNCVCLFSVPYSSSFSHFFFFFILYSVISFLCIFSCIICFLFLFILLLFILYVYYKHVYYKFWFRPPFMYTFIFFLAFIYIFRFYPFFEAQLSFHFPRKFLLCSLVWHKTLQRNLSLWEFCHTTLTVFNFFHKNFCLVFSVKPMCRR